MFGTTRTRQEFNKLLAGLPLSEKIPVLIISLGREAVKRYLKTAFYATSFNWVVGHLIDYSKQGKEYQSENALINEANSYRTAIYNEYIDLHFALIEVTSEQQFNAIIRQLNKIF